MGTVIQSQQTLEARDHTQDRFSQSFEENSALPKLDPRFQQPELCVRSEFVVEAVDSIVVCYSSLHSLIGNEQWVESKWREGADQEADLGSRFLTVELKWRGGMTGLCPGLCPTSIDMANCPELLIQANVLSSCLLEEPRRTGRMGKKTQGQKHQVILDPDKT